MTLYKLTIGTNILYIIGLRVMVSWTPCIRCFWIVVNWYIGLYNLWCINTAYYGSKQNQKSTNVIAETMITVRLLPFAIFFLFLLFLCVAYIVSPQRTEDELAIAQNSEPSVTFKVNEYLKDRLWTYTAS